MVELARYPLLGDVVDRIGRRSPFQRKHLNSYIGRQDEVFAAWAEETLDGLLGYCRDQGIAFDEIVEAYNQICMDTLKEEIRFCKTGRYSIASAREANDAVYSNPQVMRYYMYGLALSQMFWENHYRIFRFFIDFVRGAGSGRRYLEIGPGHGLFLIESLKAGAAGKYVAVDLSETSLDITKRIVQYFHGMDANVEYIHQNVYEWRSGELFDVIVVGEVLEHVDDPGGLLVKMGELLAPNGRMFITTCANCPAIDHVYLYESADAIRTMVIDCGFSVEREVALERPLPGGAEYPSTVNYAAVVKADG